MMGRLIRAQLRRLRSMYLSVVMFGVLSVTQSTSLGSRMNLALGLMMAAAALVTLGMFWSREVRVLPIPPDVAFRSSWCVMMLFPVATVLVRLGVVAVCLVAGWPPPVAAEAIAIIFAFDLVYVGATVLLQRRDGEVRRRSQPNLPLATARLLAGLTWLALPFAWPEIVPGTLAEITPLHLVALLGGAAATLWPLLFPDGKWPAFGVMHDAHRHSAVAAPPPRTTDRWLDRLHGLNRLLPGPIAGAAAVAALAFGFYVGVSRLRGPVRSLFDAEMTDVEFLLAGGVGLLLLGPFAGGSGLTPFLRRLKVLPIGSLRLCLTLTSLPLMAPVFFWMVAGLAHALIWSGAPATWRPGPLLFFCGVMSFGGALVTRFNSPMANLLAGLMPFALVMGVLMVLDLEQMKVVLPALLPAVGVTGLAAAFVLNDRTVTRASSHSPVYRQPARS